MVTVKGKGRPGCGLRSASAIFWSCNLGPVPSFTMPELLSHLQSRDSNNPHLTGSPQQSNRKKGM